MRRSWKDFGRRVVRTKTFRITAIVLLVLTVAGFIVDRALDKPLRGIIERRMNESLVGYTARVGAVDFHLIGFALELKHTLVVQNAHPHPPRPRGGG